MTNEQERMLKDNYNLIYYIMNKYTSLFRNCDKFDLESAGQWGLLKAVNSYKENKNVKFATYACKVIYNEMSMLRRKYDKIVINEFTIDTVVHTDSNGKSFTIADTLESNDLNDFYKKQEINNYFMALEYTIVKYGTSNEFKVILLKLLGKTQDETSEILKISQPQTSRLLKRILDKFKMVLDTEEYVKYKGLVRYDFDSFENYAKSLYKNIRGKIDDGANRKRAKSSRKNNENYTKVRRIRV